MCKGTGLSKLFDIQHNHFLFISCDYCGFVEIYDPDVLSWKKAGSIGTIMDILFSEGKKVKDRVIAKNRIELCLHGSQRTYHRTR
jgi:predicted nucleic-acid-binding Zn-ribbon protein